MAEMTGEMDVSWALDTLMYSNALDNTDYNGKTVSDIVNDLYGHMDSLSDNDCRAAVAAVKRYIDSPNGSETAGLILHSCSDQPGFEGSSGAKGAAFYSTNSDGSVNDIYVAYRGTGEGRWYDNGDAFNKEYSRYQQDAAEYFDSVMSDPRISESSNVIVTGHSKGGNEAQFAALASKKAYLVDKCFSFDGQGFSPEAVEYFKKLYGEDFYKQQLQKMYSISGDNDFVNVLGIKVIPDENTIYIKTPTDNYDFKQSHAPYQTPKGDNIDWDNVELRGNLFDYNNGTFYETTKEQRELAALAKSLSDNIMSLPPEEREDVCRTIMTIAEFGAGMNGETATIEEWMGLLQKSDTIFENVIFSWDGQKWINRSIHDALRRYVFQIENGEESNVFVEIICNLVALYIQVKAERFILIVYGFVKLVSKIAEYAEKLARVIEFCANVAKAVEKCLRYILDANYRAAQNYIKNENVLTLHTDDLRGLAQRLWAVNGRLGTLDSRIDGLYWKVKWSDLWNLLSSDLKICWSQKINACADCLNDTAQRFDDAEQKILGMLG